MKCGLMIYLHTSGNVTYTYAYSVLECKMGKNTVLKI